MLKKNQSGEVGCKRFSSALSKRQLESVPSRCANYNGGKLNLTWLIGGDALQGTSQLTQRAQDQL